jgi:hypothetical protein
VIAIAGVGLCTAQGTAREIASGDPPSAPASLPWPRGRAVCGIGFAARGIDPGLRGAARWRALAAAALADLGGADAPIIAASCNGGADAPSAEDWAGAFASLGVDGPIASAACASGLHALWLGASRIADGCDEVIVLAADALAAVNHDQFEGLRVLSESPAPWQASASGFVPGEAAVAIRLVRARAGDGLPRLRGPVLAHDRDGVDALAELVAGTVATSVIGQGSGPMPVDDRELAALAHLPLGVPLATPLAAFGHALGASGLLGVALAVIGRDRTLAALAMDHATASDGRALGTAHGDALVICRALGGACAVTGLDDARPSPQPWRAAGPAPALRTPLLRRIAAAVHAHRPEQPPAAIIVCLDAPIVPPEDARIGGRLLPSVVLEMTPGFLPQLVARAWGFSGPALCLVGGDASELVATCRRVRGETLVLHVRADGFEWEA